MSLNRLGQETSPYLLQHRDNPVHWWAWGADALAEAKRLDKPILLSIGYAACHWCHVMAHESFENDAIAAVMNELFVPIKVDREERPDIDTIYMSALHMMGEQGGWPLTMFLTPDAKPFWGGTYFPSTPRFGRPGFAQVLQAVSALYHDNRERVDGNVQAIDAALAKLGQSNAGDAITLARVDEVIPKLLRSIDSVHGGLDGAPKFPQPSIFDMLWRAHRRTGDAKLGEAVRRTLTAMAQGGIYDHLAGGFARYSTDAEWLVPHFEKMLYDNAQLITLYTSVWQATGEPLYKVRVAETVEWLLSDMVTEDGGFASAYDADSEGVEGKYYVWSAAEIDRLLGPAAERFKQAYDVTSHGNWEGHTILNRTAKPDLGDAAYETELAESRKILLAERAKRIPPLCDDKMLADWNGLAIGALAFAAQVFDQPHWLAAAERAYAAIVTGMGMPGDRLHHSRRLGQSRHPGTLDDYACLGRAALILGEATGDVGYVEQAERWVAVLDRHFWDTEQGGYFLSADDTTDVITRTKSVADNATPSGNGVAAELLARLYAMTGRSVYRDRAEATIQAFSGELARNFVPLASLIGAAEWLERPVQIVVMGDPGASEIKTLAAVRYRHSLATALVGVVEDEANLPADHPALGKRRVDGRATAYVCVGPVCSAPVTDPAALDLLLSASTSPRSGESR